MAIVVSAGACCAILWCSEWTALCVLQGWKLGIEQPACADVPVFVDFL